MTPRYPGPRPEELRRLVPPASLEETQAAQKARQRLADNWAETPKAHTDLSDENFDPQDLS